MNPRDKMPLEVTPVYFKLQRYDAQRTRSLPRARAGSRQRLRQTRTTPPANGSQQAPAATAPQGPPASSRRSHETQPANQDTSAQQQTPATPQ